jgi:hypothetical protein
LKLGISGNVPPKPAATSSKPAVSYARPLASKSNHPAQRPAIAAEKRKQSQRVLLRVRASVHLALKGQATTLQTSTVSVHPQGALVVLAQSLPPETRLVLEHAGTKEKISCRVARTPREMPEGFHVPLEFDSPAPGFWKIAFPPTDWCPDEA